MNTENIPEKSINNLETPLLGNGFAIRLHAEHDTGKIRIHESYELEIITSGEASIHINGRTLDAKIGTFWLSLPNNLHYVTKCNEDTEIISIKFDDNMLSTKVYNLLGMYPDGVVGTLKGKVWDTFLGMLVNIVEIYKSTQSGLCKNIFIKNAIEAILVVFVDKCDTFSQETTEETTEHNIFEAVSYVKKHFTEDLTANSMAKRLGYTPNYFSMKFKSLTGKNFIETVNDERLQLAYYMLSTMEISVGDVSEYVGYSSIAYFSRMFKKKYGKSPREVKKQEKR